LKFIIFITAYKAVRDHCVKLAVSKNISSCVKRVKKINIVDKKVKKINGHNKSPNKARLKFQ